jgi:hypothetical protein
MVLREWLREILTLHHDRYAWAERALKCGFPERFAQEALVHNSKTVHSREPGPLPHGGTVGPETAVLCVHNTARLVNIKS